MATRFSLNRLTLSRSIQPTRSATRYFSDGYDRLLREEERSAENKMERERQEKLEQKDEKEKAEKQKESASQSSEGPIKPEIISAYDL